MGLGQGRGGSSGKKKGEEKKQAVGNSKLGPRHKGCLSIIDGVGLIRVAKGE